MATIITDATAYGLDSYYADLKHIAPLSEEARRTLLACLPTTHSATALISGNEASSLGGAWPGSLNRSWTRKPMQKRRRLPHLSLGRDAKGRMLLSHRIPMRSGRASNRRVTRSAKSPGRPRFQKIRSKLVLRSRRVFRMRPADDLIR